jgi:hypothetical protein
MGQWHPASAYARKSFDQNRRGRLGLPLALPIVVCIGLLNDRASLDTP